jgi:hypothetical protein
MAARVENHSIDTAIRNPGPADILGSGSEDFPYPVRAGDTVPKVLAHQAPLVDVLDPLFD